MNHFNQKHKKIPKCSFLILNEVSCLDQHFVHYSLENCTVWCMHSFYIPFCLFVSESVPGLYELFQRQGTARERIKSGSTIHAELRPDSGKFIK